MAIGGMMKGAVNIGDMGNNASPSCWCACVRMSVENEME